ncbi:FAD/NAD(P)-binding domain-containing protein [Eremomyces bilateralis CBS 781.70]|uniref:FAD/NAD(P)-binding domain-containing protein n=1 Tax=Eremomyces bilateralis CBS 781.70 TaxID=1392243 RepID=A0A6G1G377_9PEZI|nr:FAD/NAD(P)-binding domain-containing protein [Eremomyces bilateralis CBS 781.70]KAF1812565.1 FAD/NAD(P)-binding domain-containing protein [Eremomyces bilateralis CBS 781.70]
MAPLKVIVIGGGLSGSLIANGLINHSKAPIDVVVYERDEYDANRGGYQIRLGAAALTGFRACLTKEQYNSVLQRFGRSGGVVPSAPVFYDSQLSLVLDLRKYSAYTKSAPINRALLRDLLQQLLRERNILQYGKKFVRYEALDSVTQGLSGVRAHFADGTTDDADILIAADGNRSSSNTQIGASNLVELTDRQGFLSKGALPPSLLSTLPQQLIESGSIACASKGVMAFMSVYMPDKQVNMDDRGNDTDTLKKQSIYNEEEASIMVGFNWASTPDIPNLEAVVDRKSLMLEKVKNWHPGFTDIVNVVSEDDIYIVKPRVSTPISLGWRKKAKAASPGNFEVGHPQVWLLGDAIHPMLPSRGMGANQALHDCADALEPLLQLAELKSTRALEYEDYERAVTDYEDKMVPRAFEWVKKSGGTSQSFPDTDSVCGKLFLYFMAAALNVGGAFTTISKAVGWSKEYDAPELR